MLPVVLLSVPLGLLAGVLLMEGFILRRNARDLEPAVLWLLFCAVAALGGVLALLLGLVLWKPDEVAAGEAVLPLTAALAGAAAWWFKRRGRDAGVLYLRERFYGPDPLQPPVAKKGQAFWILGWRALVLVAFAAVLGGVLRSLLSGGWKIDWKPDAVAELAPPKAGDVAFPEDGGLADADPFQAAPVGAAPLAAPETMAGKPAEMPADPAPELEAALAAQKPAEAMPAEKSTEMAAATPAVPATVPAAPVPPAAGPQPVAVPVVAKAMEPARPVSRNSQYFSKIRPIFARACVKCHGADKQKGDLALHNPDAIRAGINGKPAILPGNPEKSRVYACIILPPDDPDFMPQKGQPLSVSDRKAIFDWIKAGADLGDGVSIPSGQGGVFLVDAIAAGLPEPDATVLASLQKDHVNVRKLSQNGRMLELDFSHSDRALGDLKLAELAPIALNIHTLDLSRTRVKDADLAALAGMRNLARLILSRTEIGDAGLAHLAGNAALEEINLYSTGVTDAGMAPLAGLKSLKKVYLWQSKATAAGTQVLQQAVPGVQVSLGN
jgi:hypothetical protein